MSVIAIAFAALIDTLDGRVARLIKGTSKVGKELDSLTDVISFGVAPSFIMYFWAINEMGKIGWMLVLIYTVCCALRLARFNLTVIEETETWKINFFEGVPSPAAAGLILLPIILDLSGLFVLENIALVSSIALVITSFLMVSKLPTYSLKRIIIPRNTTIFLLLGIGIFISLLIFYTFKTLFIFGIIYLMLIPVSFFHYRHLNKKYSKLIKDVEGETEDRNLLVKVTGEQTEALVGEKGNIIRSLHELTRTVIQRQTGAGTRLRLDVADYALKRKKALTIYAERLTKQILEDKQEVMLEPMNSVDRKTLHDAVSEIKGINSYSEGREPYRSVVFAPSEQEEE